MWVIGDLVLGSIVAEDIREGDGAKSWVKVKGRTHHFDRAFSGVHQRAAHITDTLDHGAESRFPVFATLPKSLGREEKEGIQEGRRKNRNDGQRKDRKKSRWSGSAVWQYLDPALVGPARCSEQSMEGVLFFFLSSMGTTGHVFLLTL